jgi:hypothetical protein
MSITEQIEAAAQEAFPTATPLGRGYVEPNSGAGDDLWQKGALMELVEKGDIVIKDPCDAVQELDTVDVIHPATELAELLATDEDYAWSWVCSLACSARDEGVDHATANKIAARFLSLFTRGKVDVTKQQVYKDLLAKIEGLPKAAITYVDPEINHIYVSVRGFQPESGATAIAVQIQRAIERCGYTAIISAAEMDNLEQPSPSTENTLVSITAHENEGHTCSNADASVESEAMVIQ